MLIYNIGKPNNFSSAFRQLITDAAFIISVWLILNYYTVETDPFHYWVVVGGGVLIKFYKNLIDPKLYKVILNTSDRTVTANFLSAFGNKERSVIPFSECRIRIDQHSNWITREKNIIIRFYNKRNAEFEVTNGGSGISIEMLEDMIAGLERLTHLVTK